MSNKKTIKYLEVFCSQKQMDLVKALSSLANKVEVTPLEYRIFDPKGRNLHYTHLELIGKGKHIKNLIKSLQGYGN